MNRLNTIATLFLITTLVGCSDPYKGFNCLKPAGWGIGDDVAALQATRTPKVLEEDELEDVEPGATIYEYPEQSPMLGDFEIVMTKVYGDKDTMRITDLEFSIDFAGDSSQFKKKRKAIRKCYKSLRKQITKATGTKPVESKTDGEGLPDALNAVWTDTHATPTVTYTLKENIWGMKYTIVQANPANERRP